MLSERAKAVATRNSYMSEKRFKKYLRLCGWVGAELDAMWEYAKKTKKEEREAGKK